ncbi:MAG: DUF4157 domain-containing protein [Chitinophagaceae bacterium]|nr:DUF4157 domain-containing protein [Chitinophagaceae bacterium]
MSFTHITIRENSRLAKIAAWKLGVKSVAFTLGKTIHLYKASAAEFLNNEKWLRHELKHVEQFRQHGYINFVLRYLAETLKHGYYDNKYEVEARRAEEMKVK